MKKLETNLLVLFIFLASGIHMNSQTLEKDLDSLFKAAYPDDQPGAVVLIARDGKPIYRKGFGLAKLESGEPMKPENVVLLASMTKQFTAVAILMLMEEGKLSLQDPVSKYIPDYPNGENIKLHHLLTHTSGIKDLYGLPGMESKTQDRTPSEMIAIFKDEQVNFLPGDDFQYSNSNYILLGHIIEELSKLTYEEFIELKIFQPLGMKNSRYAGNEEITPNRVIGYYPEKNGNGYKTFPSASMTLAYAAGGLVSTVDDMLLWNEAIRNNKLISEKSRQLAFQPTTLNEGKTSYYGYGWRQNQLYDSPILEHGGALLGLKTSGIYLPNENIYTVILSNDVGTNPTNMGFDATAIVLGKPKNQKPVPIAENFMKQWTGTYTFEDGATRHISYKDGSLYSRLEGGEPFQLHALSENKFRFDNSFTTYLFDNKNGENTVVFASGLNRSKGFQIDTKNVTVDKTVEKSAPAERIRIVLDQAILDSYSGRYKFNSGFEIKVTTENGRIYAQTKGQPFEIFAETPEKFIIKAFPATITFKKNANGKVEGFTLDEGGTKKEALKTN